MMIAGMTMGVIAEEQTTQPTTQAETKKVDYKKFAAELDKTIYSGNDLGANYSKDFTTFKVWAPTASNVKLNLFNYGSDDEGESGSFSTKTMEFDKKTGVWSIKVNGDLAGKYYTFSVKVGDKTNETADVYAKACGVNGKRSMVVDLSSTNPEGWENDKHVTVANQTDATVWEVSVADFSSSETSGISEKNRGKFLAFTEEGTSVNNILGGSPTGIDYIKRLGVKYVQIMPFYDFGSVDESKDIMSQYNWGYDPVNYNCPEGSYSTNPYDGNVRIKECKQMIQALHNAGIGVIMDVVYNHTYSTDSVFQNTVPNYYYRMNEDGTFSNGSGCSNDTASEHKMFRKYMIDSVKYWASEYHIDGFRFDLMGLHDVETMNQIRETLDNLYEDGTGKKIIMYGEAWNMATNCDDGTILATQANLTKMSDRIGAFDDTIRDAIKGEIFGTGEGFVQTGKGKANLKTGIAGQSNRSSGWANVPTQCVTYASCHDNLCLYDKLVDTVYGEKTDYRKRYEELVAMNKLSAAIIMTSQGIPFMLAGEEFARSKDGDENSFSSSRKENMIDWTNAMTFGDMVEYYRGLMQIREAFSAFKDCTAMSANNIEYLEKLGSSMVGYTLANTEADKWNKVCVLFNGGDTNETVTVSGEWVVVADNETAGLRKIADVSDAVEVKSHSAVIMVDKSGYEKANLPIAEGVVVVNYYDNETKKLLTKQTLTGVVGTSYNLNEDALNLNFDIQNPTEQVVGTFAENVTKIDLYVAKYEGTVSTITFRFVDDINGSDLIDYYSVTNRSGQQYFTREIPTISGYKLLLSELPKNGAGVYTDKNQEVIYKYTKITDDEDTSVCRVNAIYMDCFGNILDKKTITGKVDDEYTLYENEYEDFTLVEIPANASGNFGEDEINVVFSYLKKPENKLKKFVPVVMIGVGAIAILCVASTIISKISKKRKYISNIDIDD